MMFPSYALLSGIALYASTVSATTFQIDVSNANASLIFSPDSIDAVQGDIVVFNFHPKNHSVTQSSFKEPCTPLMGGFDYGFVPVADASITPPTRQLLVNDTRPVWIHCRQAANTSAAHCVKGMVFAINAGPNGSNNSFPNFLANALASGAQSPNNQNNATNTTTPAGSTSTSTALGGSKTNGAISANIDGVNAMLMAGLGMAASLLF